MTVTYYRLVDNPHLGDHFESAREAEAQAALFIASSKNIEDCDYIALRSREGWVVKLVTPGASRRLIGYLSS